MLSILLSPFYIILNYYIARWLIKWLEACYKIFKNKIIIIIISTIYTFLASAILIGFFLHDNGVGRVIKYIGNYWLGVSLYALIVISIADLIRVIIKRKTKNKVSSRYAFVITGTVCITIIILLSGIGIYCANNTIVKHYDITINKTVPDTSSLHIVLLSDLHLGYNTNMNHIKDVVNKINNLNPDLVIIAGDIFDNDYDAIEKPGEVISLFKTIQSKYGVYASYGNHDINEKILAGMTFKTKKLVTSDPRMQVLLKDSNITLLRDEGLLLDNKFYLFGRLDYEKPGTTTPRLTPAEIVKDYDKSKPIIVIDHEPRKLNEMSSAGIDLDLSGHTHNGQLFPLTLATGIIWQNPHGVLKLGNMYSVVTAGVGVYGPNIRLGTRSEIVDLNVKLGE